MGSGQLGSSAGFSCPPPTVHRPLLHSTRAPSVAVVTMICGVLLYLPSYARVIFRANASAASGRTKLTVQPPNPAPVMRLP